MVTSLLVIVLLGLSGVMPQRQAYALFGNEAMFFILAAFMLAAAVNHRGLGRRVALTVFSRFGRTPRSLVGSICLLSVLMSFVIPEYAVAAIVFPIVLDLANTMNLVPGRSRYATALFLAMVWGTNIGGIATLLGGARATLALGMLSEATGQTILFRIGAPRRFRRSSHRSSPDGLCSCIFSPPNSIRWSRARKNSSSARTSSAA